MNTVALWAGYLWIALVTLGTVFCGWWMVEPRVRRRWAAWRRRREVARQVDTYLETCATLARRPPPSRWHRFRVRLREIVRERISVGPPASPLRDGEGRVIGAVEMPGRER